MDLGLNHVTRKFADAVDHSHLGFLKGEQKPKKGFFRWVGWLIFWKLMIQQKVSEWKLFLTFFWNQAVLDIKIYMYKWVENVSMTHD